MVAFAQRSFSGGEIAPSLYARADLVKYATGLRTCRNFAVARHGGVFNRPGTKYVTEVKTSSETVRLIPFVFNAEQTYVLEFGDQYMRVHQDGDVLTETAQNITGATNANPCIVTVTGHGYSNGDEVYITDVAGMTQINGRHFKIANVTANTFSLRNMEDTAAVDSTSWGTYSSGGTAEKVYEIATPYLEADLQTIQYAQSADVVTLVHPGHAPRELSRTGHTSWTLSTIAFAPSQVNPSGVNVTGTGGGVAYTYHVTAVNTETGEESHAATGTSGGMNAPSANPHTISWTGAAGAGEYNVYLVTNGVPGYVGTSIGASYLNSSDLGDLQDTPPLLRTVFSGAGNYPSTVAYFQQRRVFGATTNDPETIWTSRSGLHYNFTVSSPTQDNDAVTFSLSGRQVNEVRHLLEVNRLVSLTSGGEWTIEGDSAGILRPTDINAKQHAYNGAATTIPLIINGTVVYLQARGSVVRDLGFDIAVDGYRGNDLTVFASHLVDSYTIRDWAYQQIPHSIAWAARSDGTLLGMTYLREHDVLAWHHHDFDGVVEQVATVPQGTQDGVYLVIRRTINGETKRYIERMLTRREDDIEDESFMDAHLSYDGRHTGSTTMTLSGGVTWDYTESLTLTASAAAFESGDVGNAIHLTGADGTIIRFTIDAYSSTTIVTGRPHKLVPTGMRSVAISTWAKAVDEVGGLWHLEGKEVSIFGDAFVVASPNNEAYVSKTVANGTVTLDRPYGVIHAGLPITADLETLDIERVDGETLSHKKKHVGEVTMFVEGSRGIWVGAAPPDADGTDPLDGLVEVKIREDEGYDEPTNLKTGTVDVKIQPEWDSNGRVFIRQVDPVPLSVLAVVPVGMIPV